MIRAGPFLIWTYYDMITNGVYPKSEYTPSHPYIKKGLDMYLLTQFKRWERWGLLYLICIINEIISYGIYLLEFGKSLWWKRHVPQELTNEINRTYQQLDEVINSVKKKLFPGLNNASNIKSLIVRSKNEINAKKTVKEKMMKTYNTDMINVIHVRENINLDGLNTHN